VRQRHRAALVEGRGLAAAGAAETGPLPLPEGLAQRSLTLKKE
jgi:hypothetical protein